MIHLGVISILPEIFTSLNYGVTGRAIEQGLATVSLWNPRDWARGVHRQVDDRPYGGGAGMVMMYEPLYKAFCNAKTVMPKGLKTIYLSPQGNPVLQKNLCHIAETKQPLLFVAGRYEGIDERFITHHVDEEWSMGDFVLSGGEFAALAFIDAIVRLLPGSLNHPESAIKDSFMNGLLDYPQYTRPAIIENIPVPEVLLGGSHRDIERWRKKQSLGRTWLRRPDLLEKLQLSDAEIQLLIEFKNEHGDS